MNALGTLGRSREIIGLASGLVMLALWPLHRLMLVEPAWLFFGIVFLSSVAGFIVGGTSSGTGFEPSAAVRRGVLTAAIASIVAASCFTLTARVLMGPFASIRGLMGGVLSILPGMFYGMFSAGVAALVLARPSANSQKQPPEPLSSAVRWSVRLGVALLAMCAVASPFIPVTVPSLPTPAPMVTTAPPPPFAYSVPLNMIAAHAMQWQLFTHRNFGRVNGQLAALSDDDRWLAYVPEHTNGIRVVDLHSSADKGTISLPYPIDRLSFSPDADRLFVASSTSPVEIGVVDLKDHSYVALPKPKNRAMPSGRFRWWKANEVLISSGSKDGVILNLDTLEIDNASTVSSWKETLLSAQQRIMSEINSGLSKTSRWQWGFEPMIESAELPEVEGGTNWPVKQRPCLSILHPNHDCRLSFPTISSESGDRLVAAHDGSKLVRVHQGVLEVLYFSIGPSPPLRWTVTMPHAPDKCRRPDDVHAALELRQLRALVYAPMVNPLNHAVVGPDRQRVKAVVSFSTWDGEKADVYLSEQFGQVVKGDILADVSAWGDGNPDLFEMETSHRWWTELPSPAEGSDDVNALPSAEEIAVQAAGGRNRLDKARKSRLDDEREAREAKERKAAALREALKPLPPRRVEDAPPPVPAKVVAAEDRVREFVQAHYRKSRQGDVRHMVEDYADKVDYLKSGLVDRHYILQEETQFHADNKFLQEDIAGEIRLTKLGSSGYTATYTVSLRLQNVSTGQQSVGNYEVNLIVIEAPTGLKIARQRAEFKP